MKRMLVLTSSAIMLLTTQVHAQTSASPTKPEIPAQNAVQHPIAAKASDADTPTTDSTHASKKGRHHRHTINQRRKLNKHH